MKKYNQFLIESKKERISAGILLYNKNKEIFLLKAGGPLFEGRNRPWGFPKGRVDEGETNLQTAIRELKEESGIIIDENRDFIDLGKNSEIVGNLIKSIVVFATEFNEEFKF